MTAYPQITLAVTLAELFDSSQLHMDILDSTWFKNYGQVQAFPAPEPLQSLFNSIELPHPVRFESLGLIVKSGSHVSVTEAIHLWAMHKLFQDVISSA